MAAHRSSTSRHTETRPIDIEDDDDFVEVVRSLCVHIEEVVDVPFSYDELKTGPGIQLLGSLTRFLTHECEYEHIVSALL